LDDAENDLKNTGVKWGWRKKASNTDTWKMILKEAKVLQGPYREWRGEEKLKENSKNHKLVEAVCRLILNKSVNELHSNAKKI
jgi:hypothetical protein